VRNAIHAMRPAGRRYFLHSRHEEIVMKWFYDLKIARKLILSFSVVLLLVTALRGFALIQLGKVNEASGQIADN
jgi:hypothetical protein